MTRITIDHSGRHEIEEFKRRQQLERIELGAKLKAEMSERREAAAKPELERLDTVLTLLKKRSLELFDPLPWWAPEFIQQFEKFANTMEDFVREGESV